MELMEHHGEASISTRVVLPPLLIILGKKQLRLASTVSQARMRDSAECLYILPYRLSMCLP